MAFIWWTLVLAALYAGTVGWLTFGRGPFRFAYNPVVAWLLERIRKDGITLFARCYSRTRKLIEDFPNGFEPLHLPAQSWQRRWWRHEKQHNRQWRVRPFMAPVYLVLEILFGYAGNPLEHEADRAEDDV